MADNIDVTPGTGAIVATEDTGGAEYQKIKLVDGTAASTTPMKVGSGGSAQVHGEAAENAAAAGNPVLTGGRYDSSDRTLEPGDAGAIALTVAGQIRSVIDDILDDYTRQLGRVKVVNNAGTVIDPVAQVARGTTDSGAPIKTGGLGVEQTSDKTPVADAQRVDTTFTLSGLQLVQPFATPGDWLHDHGSYTTANSVVVGGDFAAPGAGKSISITDISVKNSSAVDTTIFFQEGEDGTEIHRMMALADGGDNDHFTTPIKMTANTALWAELEDAATTVYVTITGFLTTE